MRIYPDLRRLRTVALGCWAVAGWCIIYAAQLAPAALLLSGLLLGLLLLATGLAFWLLGGDQRASIIFEPKGLVLNLGHCSAFVAWDDIERVGVTRRRDSVLALGSGRQIGIALRDAQKYVQSYEPRLPAAGGVLGGGLRLVARALRPLRRDNRGAVERQLAACRAQTSYDALIPEALLGGRAEAFVGLVECYWLHPDERRTLEGGWSG
jgi:hypothetical protein